MAVADANYKFTFIDVGAYGSEGDSGVFAACEFGKRVLQDKMDFPENLPLSGMSSPVPFYFIGDDAFPLDKRILKPFAPRKPKKLTNEERIFNYRLSRARR